jgi:hypothetical protein
MRSERFEYVVVPRRSRTVIAVVMTIAGRPYR